MNETERKAAFRECPILADFLSTALQDLQYQEADNACEDGREARDSGTIYDCPDSVFETARRICDAFMRDCADDIAAALGLEPGEPGLEYSRGRYVTHERLGGTFYLASVGHGVTFTDDGNAECLQRLSDYARRVNWEGLYFGDDGKVYSL